MSTSVCLSVCHSVCLSDCLSTCISQELHVQTSSNFLCMLPLAVVQSSSSGDECYVLPVLWTMSCFSTTTYGSMTWKLCVLFCFRVIMRYLSKVADFNLLHLHLAPPLGMNLFEFRQDLWRQKLESLGYRGLFCVIISLAILTKYRRVMVTDG